MILKKVNYEARIDLIDKAISHYNTQDNSKALKRLKNLKSGLYLEQTMSRKLDIIFGTSQDILVMNDLKIKL